jgi:tetratricopeptide (TPR) repeat protein
MMTIRRQCAAALVACTAALTMHAPAQTDIGAMVDAALKAMEEEKWEEALELSNQLTEGRAPEQSKMLFGPRFGTIYYRKGIAEMKTGKWEQAMKSFETCYKEFPNPKDAGGRENPFNKMALLRWAEAAIGAREWEKAIEMFLLFLKERHPKLDPYPEGPFHISMAIAHYNLDRIEEGGKHLKAAIDGKARFPTPDNLIVAAFQELVASVIRTRNEAPLLSFIRENRGGLVSEPFIMHRYSKLLLKLAGEAIQAGMEESAMALYQFIPPADAAIDDVRSRLRSLGPLQRLNDGATRLVRADLERDLKELEADRRSDRSIDMIKLSATAFLHEKNGNVGGAHAAYLLLENFYSNAANREDNLFNLARTTAIVGNPAETRLITEKFIANFLDSRYVPTLRRMMLSSQFYDGQYEACIEIAEPMIDTLEPGTPEYDMCIHVLGGSYHYTGRFEEAQPLLDRHVKEYPESQFIMASSYLQASNLFRLGNWIKAGELLDAFLAIYPDPAENIYLPFALYDRASCHSSLDEADPALGLISRLVRDFPSASILDQAFLLRGNIEQSLKENPENAEQAFLLALDTAVKLQHPVVAGEAISWLINLLGAPDSPRIKEAVPFADRFWSEFADGSPLRARIAIDQVPALTAVDRADDAINRLRETIAESSREHKIEQLEDLIPAYRDAYLTKHSADQLKTHFFDFPGVAADDMATRALLRVSVIGVFEKIARESGEAEEKRAASALVKVLFQQLKNDFPIDQLTTSILCQLGDFLRLNTATPREALPFYDEVLRREDDKLRFRALLGRGNVHASSADPGEIDKALADFKAVFEKSEDKAQKEVSLFRIVELLVAKKAYDEANKQALVYLDRANGFKKYTTDVGMLLAFSFDKRKMMEDAIAMYMKVWSPNQGDIKIAAPAIKRWMELSWQRNRTSKDPATPSDRQGAYEGGFKYIEITASLKSQMTPEELKLWQEVEELVKTYEAAPEIKSMAQIRREKEAAGGIRLRK